MRCITQLWTSADLHFCFLPECLALSANYIISYFRKKSIVSFDMRNGVSKKTEQSGISNRSTDVFCMLRWDRIFASCCGVSAFVCGKTGDAEIARHLQAVRLMDVGFRTSNIDHSLKTAHFPMNLKLVFYKISKKVLTKPFCCAII